MATDPQDEKNKKGESLMGITFSEVHSDEPHETIDAQKAEVKDTRPRAHASAGTENVFDITRAFIDEHAEQGTIVSDRKHRKPSFNEALKDAWNEWWGKTKVKVTKTVESIPKIQKEEPVIEKAETRAEVVKAAAENANIAPKDDHRVVVEKFRTFKQDYEKVTGAPFTIKEPSTRESSWSHVAEEKPGTESQKPRSIPTPDMRSSVIAPVIEKRIQKNISDFAPAHSEEKKPAPVPVKPVPPKVSVAPLSVPPTVPKKEIEVPKPVHIPPPVQVEKKVVEPPKPPQPKPVPPPPAPKPEPLKPPVPPSEWRVSAAPKTPEVKPIPEVPKQPVTPPAPEQKVLHEEIPPPPVPRRESAPSFTPAPRQDVHEETYTPPERTEPEPMRASEAITTPSAPYEFRGDTSDELVVPRQLREEHVRREAQQRSVSYAPSGTSRHMIRYAIYLLIVILGVVLAFVAIRMFNVFEETPRETGTVITIPAFFASDSQVPVPLGSEKNGFLASLADKVGSAPSGLTQFYPTQSDGVTNRSVTAEEFFSFLNVGMRDASVRALEDTFMMGSITTVRNEPFIIIRSYNFDALFAGLLSWEETLQQDLAPLFGTPEAQPSFKDAVRNNKSIRILYDVDGNEVLLYSFINQNTVVITSSTDALSRILSEF